VSIKPIGRIAYIYASIQGIKLNPISYNNGLPDWNPIGKDENLENEIEHEDILEGYWKGDRKAFPENQPILLETISLGHKYLSEHYISFIKFGLADDGRCMDRANVTLWINDGNNDYYGPCARPKTVYFFKIKLDFILKELTAWVLCEGDDEWFLLAEKASIIPTAEYIDMVRIEQYPNGPDIEELILAVSPIKEKEEVHTHSIIGSCDQVGLGKGFRFQSMRSIWRKLGKQITIFRRADIHCAFPDIVKCSSKHIICVWRNGSHSGGTGGLYLSHSYNGGITWSDPVLVTPLHINTCRLQRLKSGKLLLTGDIRSPIICDQYTARWDVMMWESNDEGHTWNDARCLTTKESGGPGAIVHSRILELSNGSWLLSTSSFFKPQKEVITEEIDDSYLEKLEFYGSKDKGNTWKHISGQNAWPPYSLSEPTTLETSDGQLVVFARESRCDGMPGAKGYSYDGGRTWEFYDLPFPVVGRTCGGFLEDGRVMLTFRSNVGRASLWAWIGNINDMTGAQPVGVHYNDKYSVGLRDGELHIENNGTKGQFTLYRLRSADNFNSVTDLEFEVKVMRNEGRAASVSIPFGGILRIFPDHIVMKHDSSLKASITSECYHKYRIESKVGNLRIFVDNKLVIDTAKGDSECLKGTKFSKYELTFGNESNAATDKTFNGEILNNITPEVTGYSVWKGFKAKLWNPEISTRTINWLAQKGEFPDQYQLDNIIEIEASITGTDQGYSGWVQLEDGNVFIANYTDDTSAACIQNPYRLGVPWIRGSFLKLDELL